MPGLQYMFDCHERNIKLLLPTKHCWHYEEGLWKILGRNQKEKVQMKKLERYKIKGIWFQSRTGPIEKITLNPIHIDDMKTMSTNILIIKRWSD